MMDYHDSASGSNNDLGPDFESWERASDEALANFEGILESSDCFSPEYIEFMCKAKCLQDRWMPTYGDWCVQPEWSMDPALVLEPDGIALHEAFWLPTLWDLVQIIWEAKRHKSANEGQLLWPSMSTILTELAEATIWEADTMLVAAKLAVKALEAAK
jgi:hypothetical protein